MTLILIDYNIKVQPTYYIMNTLIISLPNDLKDVMYEQIAKGLYANASDYIEKLIMKDKAAKESSELVTE